MYMSFNKLGFLHDKIYDQHYGVETRSNRWHGTRFGSLVFDLKYIKERPLTGWGLHPKTRYALDPWVTEEEGNG